MKETKRQDIVHFLNSIVSIDDTRPFMEHVIYVQDVGFIATDGWELAIVQCNALASEEIDNNWNIITKMVNNHKYQFVTFDKKTGRYVAGSVTQDTDCQFPTYNKVIPDISKYECYDLLNTTVGRTDYTKIIPEIERKAYINAQYLDFPELNDIIMAVDPLNVNNPVVFTFSGTYKNHYMFNYSCLYVIMQMNRNGDVSKTDINIYDFAK
jgi:hypothetical protein